MTLSRKVTTIIGLIILLSFAASLWLQRSLIAPSFLKLERETAAGNAERVLSTIDRELEQISPQAADWSNWTDTYRFAQGRENDYLAENFVDDVTLESMQLNYFAILDTEGTIVFQKGWDLEESAESSIGVFKDEPVPAEHPLRGHLETPSEVSGLIATQRGSMLVVAKPILKNNKSGPSAGTMVMGRLFDEVAVARLVNQTRLALSVSKTSGSAHAEEIVPDDEIGRTPTDLVERPDVWQATTTLRDVYGQPILDITVETGREITARGDDAMRLSLISLALMGLVTLLLLISVLRYLLFRPMDTLTAFAGRIGQEGSTAERLASTRRDEIGLLAGTLDSTLDRLDAAQRDLLAQSYRSGAAETASGVLHNIGNAITPLNVRLSNLYRDLRTAPTAEIDQAVAELADPATSTERAADLRAFVELAAVETAALVRHCGADVDLAGRQIVNVQQILDDQQRLARAERVLEAVDMDELITDAAAGLSPEMQAVMQIEIDPSVAATGPVQGTRAALLQVVTNLLVNSAEAIVAKGPGNGLLRVDAVIDEQDGVSLAHLCFSDNGSGISAEHLPRVFEYGFSTRERDGSGQGLHWSANTAGELGGSLNLENDDTGQGCRAHLKLPLAAMIPRAATGTGG